MSHSREGSLTTFLVGLFLGVAGGLGAGLLYAPKPGKQTKAQIHRFMRALPERIDDEVNNPGSKTRGMLTRTQVNFQQQVDKVNHSIQANRIAQAKRREELASETDS